MKALQYASWLTWRAGWVWGSIVPLPALALCFYLPAMKGLATVVATVLQFAGLVVAFVGVTGDAKSFGRKLHQPFKDWWEARPGNPRRVVASFALNLEAGAVGFAVTRLKSPATDVDGRLAWLEQRLYTLQEQADSTAHSLHKLTEKTTRDLDGERKQREAGDAELKGQLAKHAADGVHLNLVALWWVFAGMVLSAGVSLAAP